MNVPGPTCSHGKFSRPGTRASLLSWLAWGFFAVEIHLPWGLTNYDSERARGRLTYIRPGYFSLSPSFKEEVAWMIRRRKAVEKKETKGRLVLALLL
jgi:hypothetical protein